MDTFPGASERQSTHSRSLRPVALMLRSSRLEKRFLCVIFSCTKSVGLIFVVKVRHVLNWRTRSIGIGTGVSCNIFVTDMLNDSAFILRCSSSKLADAFSASFDDKTLLLGTRKSLAIIDDIYHQHEKWRTLNCGSDVMAVCQHSNTVFAGCRNGTIQLFDLRDSRTRGSNLLDNRYQRKGSRFVSHINVIRDWELLISTSAGDLEMFDLRYSASSTPITTFVGHVNSVRNDLGITVDPSNEILLAAGEDRVVRGWSLKSGRPLRNQITRSTNLLRKFNIEEEITCMQVTEESDGLRLWVTCGNTIKSFNLGVARDNVSQYDLDVRL